MMLDYRALPASPVSDLRDVLNSSVFIFGQSGSHVVDSGCTGIEKIEKN
jgi:hypothetical protein